MTDGLTLSKLLYRLDETADLLSCSKATVRRLIEEGELTAHVKKFGTKGLRVTAESILKYVDKYKA